MAATFFRGTTVTAKYNPETHPYLLKHQKFRYKPSIKDVFLAAGKKKDPPGRAFY